ncbi:peroxisome proliferator-activated receptor gamma coactivator-related protein 1-like [Pseudophryne corroboree]|uniref:peroxisome proliferator-activated receptor gamma coactivator-related protein 1-like n=1 Tax=Pseudophryne corroboree TaxID=495146 RepID=UPI0030814673
MAARPGLALFLALIAPPPPMRRAPRVPAKKVSEARAKMAARWGTGEETLTIGGMEFFAAGGRHQCHDLEDDEASDSLSGLALDAGGILGTFQGYIDNSLISIIDDSSALAQNIGHLDEENELTLLTALTEILDNTDNENMSPFDTIPDTELLVSSKGRDISSMDSRCSGPNWDLFPDSVSSTPKRHNRHKSLKGCLSLNQRSDGEDEEVQSPEKSPGLLAFDKDFSIETGVEIRELERERYLKQGTPCIINTENVTLHDLVKYMHPYCLPAITVCLEPEDGESLLNESVFLEIVSDQGECIKVPVVVEHPGDDLSPMSSGDNPPTPDSSGELHMETQLSPESALEQCDHGHETNHGKHLPSIENTMGSMKGNECLNKELTVVPGIEDIATKPLTTDETVAINLNNKRNTICCNPDLEGMVQDSKKNGDPVVCEPVTGKERLRLKGKKSSKDDKLLNTTKSKVKSKNKRDSEDVPHTVTPQSNIQPTPSRLNNPALQESDVLMRTLEQMKKDSQMELRLLRVGRTKVRTRANLDSTNPVRKMTVEAFKDVFTSPRPLEESNLKRDGDQRSGPDVAPESAVSEDTQFEETSGQDSLVSAAPDIHLSQTSSLEDLSLSKSEDGNDCDSTQCTKETKPKSLSLSEYRKRLQHRKPNPEQENDHVSCSKWPSIPEPPTELAELPCLIVPTKLNKPLAEEKRSVPSKAEESSSELNVPVSLGSVPSNVALTSVYSQEVPQLKPTESACTNIVDLIPPPVLASQPNVPPPIYPPNWPTVPLYPAFYPGMPPLPVAPQFPNCMPPLIPMRPPPPVLGWPSFPPPPIALGPVHPAGWVSGPPPPPYWSNSSVPPMVSDNRCMQSSAENSAPVNVLPPEMPKVTPFPSVECSNQAVVLAKGQANQIPTRKPEHNRIDTRESKIVHTLKSVEHTNSTFKASKVCPPICPSLKKSDLQSSPIKAVVEKVQSKPPQECMKENVTDPDQQSTTNQTIFKIMEILKKAQKLGYRIKPPLVSSESMPSTPPGGEKSPVSALKPAEPEQTVLAGVCAQEVPTPVAANPSIVPMIKPKVDVIIPTTQCDTSKVAVEGNPVTACILPNQSAQEPCLPSPADEVCASGESIPPNHREPEETCTYESGIVASDLSSLLEQFEKYEAKDEERRSPSPDKLVVEVSGSGKPVEEEMRDKHPAPELVTITGVAPPAAPSSPDCKPVISGPLLGKSKSLHGLARSRSSPLKTTKLIEAIPLPRSRLRNQNGSVTHVALPPVHVASGEHDYCFLSASCREQSPITDGNRVTTVTLTPPAQCEEGSRWNVKHHQHITIKPIVQFNTQQKKSPLKLPASSAPSVVPNQSTDCGLVKPEAPYKSIQKDSNAPLDHRIPATAESAGNGPPGSVLRSSDPLPYHSDCGESRTDVKRENSVSRRSLRCYRKYTRSPSPQQSTGSERSSRSCSGSSSSSSSTSRSRSPPSKRRRTYRSRSHHRRSSSRSSCGTDSSSRSSSRSCSSSSSLSRSRSRSPYRQSYRSRSRRCQSRDSYRRQKNYRKDLAIKERRVVYIGKISSRMTRSELSERFSVFGNIEDCTIHFREKGDNYGFVTYSCTEEAFAAIESGHKLRLPDELAFDLCFGGRRQFCKSNYADLDSNRDDFDPVLVRSKLETLDFETLLREAQKSHRR